MPNITIKNLPPAIYERLKEKAKINRRSLNNEVIVMLEQNLGMRAQEFIEPANRVQDVAADYVTAKKETGSSDAEKYPLRGQPVIYHEPTQPAVSETEFLSEPALAKDWDRPEEDEAWAHLQPGATETDTKSKEKDKYPLRGKPVIYHEPFKGVAEDEWEASK